MNKDKLLDKMDSSYKFFEKELSSIRTSRANPNILDSIYVDVYGSKTPINQLGNINVPDSNMITIQVWDNTIINQVENAIMESNLGLNPQTEGQLIRLPIPKLSEERRDELAKLVSQYGEKAKIAIRNNRREMIEIEKTEEKDKKISIDESKKNVNEIQKITDDYIKKVDETVKNKQQEILKV